MYQGVGITDQQFFRKFGAMRREKHVPMAAEDVNIPALMAAIEDYRNRQSMPENVLTLLLHNETCKCFSDQPESTYEAGVYHHGRQWSHVGNLYGLSRWEQWVGRMAWERGVYTPDEMKLVFQALDLCYAVHPGTMDDELIHRMIHDMAQAIANERDANTLCLVK